MEETIQYELHLPSQTDNRIDYLKAKLDSYLAYVKSKTHEFIWNKEDFNLSLSTPLNDQLQFIVGSTDYGDNVDDEWFVVYLLYELTKLDNDLIISAEDSDGQFLLIEAANDIPKWLDPSNSENRVFIYQGKMRIIPKAVKLDGDLSSNSKITAIEYVRNQPDVTLADRGVQDAIENKIKRCSRNQLHRAKCFLPLSIVKILDNEPQLISKAVNAFYERDPYEARSLRSMKRFQPNARIYRTVTFTRNLYAKIIHNIYVPDKRSGWVVPPKNSPEFKAHDLGLKIACGFEILLRNIKVDSADDNQNGDFASFDYDGDPKWQKYLGNLVSYGYFRDELEGSKLYKELLDKAKESYYYSFIKKSCQQNPSHPTTRFDLSKIKTLMNLTYDDCRKYKADEGQSHSATDDDDSWLNVTAEQLDILLEECFTINKDRKTVGPEDVTKLMRNFVKRKNSKLNKDHMGRTGKITEETYEGTDQDQNEKQKLESVPTINADDENIFDEFSSSSNSTDCEDEIDDDYDQEDDFDHLDYFEGECSSDTDIDEITEEDQRLEEEFETMIKDLQKLGKDTRNVSGHVPNIAACSSSSLRISDYMKLMDKELESTNVGIRDFIPEDSNIAPTAKLDSDDDSDEDEVRDAKMDAAICHNLLEAYNAGLEANQPGAACNMLQSMRLLPSKAIISEVGKKT